MGSLGTDPPTLNLSTMPRRMVSFTFQSLYPRCIASCARSRTGLDTTKKRESLDFPGSQTMSLGVSNRSLIATEKYAIPGLH